MRDFGSGADELFFEYTPALSSPDSGGSFASLAWVGEGGDRPRYLGQETRPQLTAKMDSALWAFVRAKHMDEKMFRALVSASVLLFYLFFASFRNFSSGLFCWREGVDQRQSLSFVFSPFTLSYLKVLPRSLRGRMRVQKNWGKVRYGSKATMDFRHKFALFCLSIAKYFSPLKGRGPTAGQGRRAPDGVVGRERDHVGRVDHRAGPGDAGAGRPPAEDEDELRVGRLPQGHDDDHAAAAAAGGRWQQGRGGRGPVIGDSREPDQDGGGRRMLCYKCLHGAAKCMLIAQLSFFSRRHLPMVHPRLPRESTLPPEEEEEEEEAARPPPLPRCSPGPLAHAIPTASMVAKRPSRNGANQSRK